MRSDIGISVVYRAGHCGGIQPSSRFSQSNEGSVSLVYTALVKTKTSIVGCPYCEARVQAREVAFYERQGPEDEMSWPPYRLRTYSCSVCEHALVYMEVATDMDDGPNTDDEGVVPGGSFLPSHPRVLGRTRFRSSFEKEYAESLALKAHLLGRVSVNCVIVAS